MVFFHQVGNPGGNGPKKDNSFRILEIDNWPEMKFTSCNMGMVNAAQAILGHNFLEFCNVLGENPWVNGSILYQRNRFGVSGNVGKQTETSLAQGPNFFGILAGDQWEMVAQSSFP